MAAKSARKSTVKRKETPEQKAAKTAVSTTKAAAAKAAEATAAAAAKAPDRCRDGSRVRCFTRNGHDWADRFPAIVDAALRIQASSFLIDGETVIARDAGLPCAAEPTPGPGCGAVRLQARAGGYRVKAAQRRISGLGLWRR
jgi:outer membrane biosynthesis protein TonB